MRSELKFKYTWWTLAHLIAFAILVVCLIPSMGRVSTYEHIDKFFHFGAHGLLAFCYTQLWNNKNLISLFLFQLVYGFAIEVLQFLTGWRTFDLLDVLANASGSLYGIVFALSLGSGFFLFIEKLRDQSRR